MALPFSTDFDVNATPQNLNTVATLVDGNTYAVRFDGIATFRLSKAADATGLSIDLPNFPFSHGDVTIIKPVAGQKYVIWTDAPGLDCKVTIVQQD